MGEAPDARRIMRECIAMLERAQAVVADLSPIRGPHVDDGTAFEIGFATARSIPVFGYADDLRPLAARIMPRGPGESVDADGIAIETLDEPCNAMIAGSLACPAFATAEEAVAVAARHLHAVGHDSPG